MSGLLSSYIGQTQIKLPISQCGSSDILLTCGFMLKFHRNELFWFSLRQNWDVGYCQRCNLTGSDNVSMSSTKRTHTLMQQPGYCFKVADYERAFQISNVTKITISLQSSQPQQFRKLLQQGLKSILGRGEGGSH